jgi:hypothetical protein
VLDWFIHQSLLQVLQEQWDPGFSEARFGFRPGCGAQKALARTQEHLDAGYRWVGDMDLEKFFDRVNQAKNGVGRPWERTFPGFTVTPEAEACHQRKALERTKARIREAGPYFDCAAVV